MYRSIEKTFFYTLAYKLTEKYVGVMLENAVCWKYPRFFRTQSIFISPNNQMTTQTISFERGKDSEYNGIIYFSKF